MPTPEENAANLAKLQSLETGQKETAPAIIDPLHVAKTPPKTSTEAGIINPLDVAAGRRGVLVGGPIGGDPQLLKKDQAYPRPDPDRVKTVGEEQLERSEKMMRDFGTPHKYMASLDTRDPADRPQAVPGVGFTQPPAGAGDRPNPSLYPSNWATMTDAEKASWEASHLPSSPSLIDPKKVAANAAHT